MASTRVYLRGGDSLSGLATLRTGDSLYCVVIASSLTLTSFFTVSRLEELSYSSIVPNIIKKNPQNQLLKSFKF